MAKYKKRKKKIMKVEGSVYTNRWRDMEGP